MGASGIFRFRATGIVLILVIAAAWEYFSGLLQSQSWPTISQISVSMVAGLATGELTGAFLATLRTTAIGFVIGVGAGVTMGLLMAISKYVHGSANLLVELLRPIPIPAIIPPLILIFGIDDGLKIFVVAFSVFFPVLVNTISGVRSVDKVSVDVGRNLRAGQLRILLQIILPASMPYILAGMRIGVSLSLLIAVTAEMIAGAAGVGYYLMAMQYAMRAADMYAAVFLLALVGYILNRGFLVVEARILHWYKAKGG